MDRKRVAETIKESVSMLDVVKHYGLEPNRAGFVICPFHSEDTPSMKIYEKSFYCFGCQSGGDVISFTERYLNLDFNAALRELISAFYLPIDLDRKPSFRELLQAEEAKQKREEEHTRKSKLETERETWLDIFVILDRWKEENRPLAEFELDNPKFVYACKNIDRAWSGLSEAEDKLYQQTG